MTDLEKIIHATGLETLESRHLLKFIHDLCGDARDAIEIIDCWLAEIPGLAEKMRSALDAGDQQALKGYAHTIKSAARSIGAMQLGDLAERLQQEGMQGRATKSDAPVIKSCLDTTVRDLNALREALRAGE